MDLLYKIILDLAGISYSMGSFFLIKLFMKLVGHNEEYSYRSLSYTF